MFNYEKKCSNYSYFSYIKVIVLEIKLESIEHVIDYKQYFLIFCSGS